MAYRLCRRDGINIGRVVTNVRRFSEVSCEGRVRCDCARAREREGYRRGEIAAIMNFVRLRCARPRLDMGIRATCARADANSLLAVLTRISRVLSTVSFFPLSRFRIWTLHPPDEQPTEEFVASKSRAPRKRKTIGGKRTYCSRSARHKSEFARTCGHKTARDSPALSSVMWRTLIRFVYVGQIRDRSAINYSLSAVEFAGLKVFRCLCVSHVLLRVRSVYSYIKTAVEKFKILTRDETREGE